MSITLARIDHFVLTVADIPATCAFYERLGMEVERFGAGRIALRFGAQKINLQQHGAEIDPKAAAPAPGTGDFCLIAETSLDAVIQHLHDHGVQIEEGPVPRTGATGPIRSVYLRDPDGNLVEIAEYT